MRRHHPVRNSPASTSITTWPIATPRSVTTRALCVALTLQLQMSMSLHSATAMVGATAGAEGERDLAAAAAATQAPQKSTGW
jgi:hypothetical protein